jgi:tetratricopeptide (TPR) repeat protein
MTLTQPIPLPLTLRPAPAAAAREPAAAWFVPGEHAPTWLAELCAWGVPLDEVRLIAVPRSPRNRTPCGVLAVVPQRLAPGVKPSALAEPYLMIGDRLYLPLHAELHPPLSEDERRAWLVLEVNVFHPTVGLVGCARNETLRVSDLIAAPTPGAVEWGYAVPGVAVEARLRSVKAVSLPPIERFIRESKDGIGDEDPRDLPKLPSESPLRNLANRGAAGALGALAWLSGKLGGAPGAGADTGAAGTGAPPGWMQSLHDWSSKHLAALRPAIEEARNREMARLMRMLESNPDEGLRYAPPLAGQGGRGVAPPGFRLLRRGMLDFNLGSLFSSAPADAWDARWDVHQKLMARYRELATRELQLGRHRRAAYIFAQLLGDLHAAAGALRKGRFHREAAALYRDKLKDCGSAAACLEEGGLLTEAIELYESMREFEKVGDLRRKLGDDEGAELAYREAVRAILAAGDVLRAARLLESKLSAHDEAIELLEPAWPHSAQAGPCLEELFALLGRSARHERAARRANELREQPPDSALLSRPLADVLAKVATSYPSFDVRRIAADATRVVAGARLPSAESLEARALVNAVVRVSVEDRLLARDADRYIDRVLAKPKPPKPQPARIPTGPQPKLATPVVKRVLHLGVPATWRAALSVGSTFYALGTNDDEFVCVRGSWDGTMQQARWRQSGAAETTYRLHHGGGLGAIIVPAGGSTQRPPHKVLPAHRYFAREELVGTPAFFPPGPLFDASVDEDGTTWVLHAVDESPHLVISSYSRAGGLTASQYFPMPVPDSRTAGHTHLVVRNGHMCVIIGAQAWVGAHGKWHEMTLPRPVEAVSASAPHTRMRVALAFDEGARMLWPMNRQSCSLAQGLVDPVISILRDGTVSAVGRGRGMLFRTSGYQLVHAGTYEAAPSPPVAVVPTHEAGEFAVFRPDGAVQVYSHAGGR